MIIISIEVHEALISPRKEVLHENNEDLKEGFNDM
jgi:hypothetical protein